MYDTATGYAKRTLSVHEAAPYQLLVDHLSAAATETKEIFVNSSVECPAKPSDYVCPQILKLTKDELKAKICEYDSVLVGGLKFKQDEDKFQTRCGALDLVKHIARVEEEAPEVSQRTAVVLGKSCPGLEDIYSGKTEQVHMLIKTPIPSGVKFILVDGTNVSLLDSSLFKQEELVELMKQCPKQQASAKPQNQQQQPAQQPPKTN